jgi:hypothetical protein
VSTAQKKFSTVLFKWWSLDSVLPQFVHNLFLRLHFRRLIRKECGMAKRTGLDGRHRDQTGEISRKKGNTLVGTLRKTYPDFAEGRRSDMKLENVLKEEGADSLSEYLKGAK